MTVTLCGAPRKKPNRDGDTSVIGRPCGHPAGWNTDHLGVGRCSFHQGNSRMSRQHGAKVLADMALRKELKAFGVPLEGSVSPEQVLLHMVREAAGNVAFLGARMAELSEKREAGDSRRIGAWNGATVTLGVGEGLFGPKIGLDKDGGEHVIGEEVRAATALYGEWSDRLVKYAKTAIDAGIAKAQVELARTQGQTIVVVVNRVLVQIGLGEEQQNRARELLAEEFRLLAASPTELLEVGRE